MLCTIVHTCEVTQQQNLVSKFIDKMVDVALFCDNKTEFRTVNFQSFSALNSIPFHEAFYLVEI